MPHGPLTPLGRQLRSVLATLRPFLTNGIANKELYAHRTVASNSRSNPRVFSSALVQARIHNGHVRRQSAVPTQASATGKEREEDNAAYRPFEPDADEAGAPWKSLNEQWRKPWIKVHRGQHSWTSPKNRANDTSASAAEDEESHLNDALGWRAEDDSNENGDLQSDEIILTQEHRLSMLLERYIEHKTAAEETEEAKRKTDFELSAEEQNLLDSRGYVFNNFKGWAEMVMTADSFAAATRLESLRAKYGPISVPVFVVSYVLRRSHVTASALRLLMPIASATVEFYNSPERQERLDASDIFKLFERLLRHARVVLPTAIENLPDMLLQHLPHNASLRVRISGHPPFTTQRSEEQRATLSYKLNKAMRLLAVRTSVEPFKNNAVQETAIIKILRFMADHDPPLGINREGYRAVILVQLAQPKSLSDRQWAELKILSWPPWKEERTAMDADITVEQHGKPKAAETLEQMRDAGYGHKAWEKTATVYTGWDIDRTPTIQTRILFGSSNIGIESGAAVWAARITATRTVQEAWACYLAYEDENLPQSQHVYLAIFRKLYEEELRLQGARKYQTEMRGKEKLWPGDTREIEPLPHSTHLYTYTRTPPPTVDEFYRQLRQRGVITEGHCLAFLVATAGSLKLGIEYLYASAPRIPSVPGLLFPRDLQYDLNEVPMPIFAAFVELLGRFSKVPLTIAMPVELKRRSIPELSGVGQTGRLNPNHTLVHAIELLTRRRPLYRPAWNAVLRALGHESSHGEVLTMFDSAHPQTVESFPARQGSPRAAVTAYRSVYKVLALMKEMHVSLDIVGFHAVCQAVENATIGCWKTLCLEQESSSKPDERFAGVTSSLRDATTLMQDLEHVKCMKEEFGILVGEENISSSPRVNDVSLPPLLEVPGPALLHAYLRALGWAADYDGLVETTRWMVKYATELAERRARDHNGERLMRKVIVAIRVFLDRSWLSSSTETEEGKENAVDAAETDDSAALSAKQLLLRLERPAREELVNEVRELIESVEVWGGWPTDDEVDGYTQHYRFQQLR